MGEINWSGGKTFGGSVNELQLLYLKLWSQYTILSFTISPSRLRRSKAGAQTFREMATIPPVYHLWFLTLQINNQRRNFLREAGMFIALCVKLTLYSQMEILQVLPLSWNISSRMATMWYVPFCFSSDHLLYSGIKLVAHLKVKP